LDTVHIDSEQKTKSASGIQVKSPPTNSKPKANTSKEQKSSNPKSAVEQHTRKEKPK
jgi:hypothetical protein